MRKKSRKWIWIFGLGILLLMIVGYLTRSKSKNIKMDPRLVVVSEVASFLKDIQPNELNIKLNGSILTTDISDGPVILLDTDHMPDNWKNTLQVILERSRIIGKYPLRIDLRFQSPILNYGQE